MSRGSARTLGVIPQHLVDYEVADTDSDELVVVDTMRERKALMDASADAARTDGDTGGGMRALPRDSGPVDD